jgi:hypothetical protein
MAGEWSQAARGVLRAVRAVRAVQAAVPQRGAGARSVPPGLQAPWQSKSPLDAQARSGLAWGRRRSLGALSWPPQSAWLAMHAAPARERGLRSSAVVCTPAEPSAGGSKRHSAVVDVLYDGECPLCVHEITWLRRRNQVGRWECGMKQGMSARQDVLQRNRRNP